MTGRRHTLFLSLGLVLASAMLTGCGKRAAEAVSLDQTPLSMEDWRRIREPHIRLDPDTLERLKKGNPALRTREGWEAFERDVLSQEGSQP